MAHRESRGIALLFLNHGARRGEVSALRPGRSLPLEKTWYPLYRRLVGPQGRSGQVRKVSSPSGFYPRTVQPVASRYTVYATRPRNTQCAVVTTTARQSQSHGLVLPSVLTEVGWLAVCTHLTAKFTSLRFPIFVQVKCQEGCILGPNSLQMTATKFLKF